MAAINALHKNYVWNGDKTMELSHQYVTAHRTNPTRMQHVIQKTEEDIKEIVFRYSNGLTLNQKLFMDIKEMVRSYLIINGVHDLFQVKLEEAQRRWTSSIMVSKVQFTYNEKKESVLQAGVTYHYIGGSNF